MLSGQGRIVETFFGFGCPAARLSCPPGLVPAPGQYLLAHLPDSDDPLPIPVFPAGFTGDGFLAAPSLPDNWMPGTGLCLRGPLGHGFNLPLSARRVTLAAFDDAPARLLGLLDLALKQNAAVVLACEAIPPGLPADVEVHPLADLPELMRWADYLAVDLDRAHLSGLRESLGLAGQAQVLCEAQVLVITPMPCGALAECDVCAVPVRRGHLLACKDGPVFPLPDLLA